MYWNLFYGLAHVRLEEHNGIYLKSMYSVVIERLIFTVVQPGNKLEFKSKLKNILKASDTDTSFLKSLLHVADDML